MEANEIVKLIMSQEEMQLVNSIVYKIRNNKMSLVLQLLIIK